MNRAKSALELHRSQQVYYALEKEVGRLSELFTTGRGEGGSYAGSLKSWLAYGLYFFPQTFMRIRLIREELQARGSWPEGPLRILDLGCGTGAAGFALAAGATAPHALTGVDRAGAALALAEELALAGRELWPGLQFTARRHDIYDPQILDGKWDVIVSSYALNEVFPGGVSDVFTQWLAAAAAHLAPGGVLLLCEPVVRGQGSWMPAVRTLALGQLGLTVLAPCLHQQVCPMAAMPEEICHDVRFWKVPDSTRMVNRHLFRDVEHLKLSFLALGRAPVVAAGGVEHARVVSPVRPLKGKWTFRGCAADGKIHEYEILRRHLDPEERQGIKDRERGDLVKLDGLEPAGPRCLRCMKVRPDYGAPRV